MLHYGDSDPTTIEMVVVPDSMRTQASIPSGYSYPRTQYETYVPTLGNSAVVIASAANGRDRPIPFAGFGYPATTAHEAGHLLFDREIDGMATDAVGHTAGDATNLMVGAASPGVYEQSPEGRKRLTLLQQRDARRDGASLMHPMPPPGLPPGERIVPPRFAEVPHAETPPSASRPFRP